MTDQNDAPEQLNPDGTRPGSAQGQSGGERAILGDMMTPRTSPKGTRLVDMQPDGAVIEIRCLLQLWFWLAPLIAVVVGFLLIPASIPFFFVNPFTGQNEAGTGILILLIAVGAVVLSIKLTRRWTKVTISNETITFGNQVFDRQYAGKFRVGYSVEGDETLRNNFYDQSLGLSSLRLEYGPWGEDLPYLVNKYHSAEIVVWANAIIDEIGAPEPKDHDPNEGRTKEIF